MSFTKTVPTASDLSQSVVSAPGKVLLTGAYLVLERPNAGLVLSTSARFFAIVRPLYPTVSDDSWAWAWTDVKVVSPQLFKEATYKLSLRNFTLQKVSPLSDDGNGFVEKGLELAIVASKVLNTERPDDLKKLLLKGLEITILGSNDFYSYRKHIEAKGLPLNSASLASLPPFSPITLNTMGLSSSDNTMLPEVAKTGLGSSAAMTTAVVASLLHYLKAVHIPHGSMGFWWQGEQAKALGIVHSLSQAAHSLAQGKIGSGFDVSAAVYGSQQYVRFCPSILSSLQESAKYMALPDAVTSLLNKEWDTERKEYALPPFLELIVGEPGFGGSHTPSMVGAIQTWRNMQPEKAGLLWSKLGQANIEVECGLLQLKSLAKKHGEDYKSVLQYCENMPCQQWKDAGPVDVVSQSILQALLDTRTSFRNVRSLLQQMGEAAGVPVEPPSQTALLDATMNIEGVLFAGVPGAGGFDAVFAVTLGTYSRVRVDKEWSKRGVLALCVKEDSHGVQQESGDPRDDSYSAIMQSLKLDG